MRITKVAFWQKALCCVIAGSLAAPSVAFAAPRYQKNKASIKVKQTELTKELKSPPKTGSSKAKGPSSDVTADDLIMAEEKVGDIRLTQIKKYEMLITAASDDCSPKDGCPKADYIFRLAEIYAQQRRLHHFKAMEADFKAQAAKKAGDKNKWNGIKKNEEKQERDWLLKAVKEYTRVANNAKWKPYNRMDSVLFFLAYMLTQAQMDGEARSVFKRLIKDYPQSKFIPDAHLAFADYFFAKGDMDGALDFYNKVLSFKESGVYGYAKYKTAWVYYNLGDPDKALETLIGVVFEMKSRPKTKTLVRAARKDVVRVYAEIGEAGDKSYNLFLKVADNDKDEAFTMLTTLGELYLGSGKFKDAITTYHLLMKKDPKHKELCNWQHAIFRAQYALPGDDKRVKELERLVEVFKAAEEKKITLPQAQYDECKDNAMNTTSELARLWHTEAIDENNNVRLADRLPYVTKLYTIYMKNFPNAEDAGEMRLYAAELVWTRAEKESNAAQQRQLFAEAAEIYTAIAKTPGEKQDVVKEAAYSAMQAWKNALEVDTTKTDIKTDKTKQERKEVPIPDNLKKLMESFDLYIQYVKPTDKDEDYVFMKFHKARIFYEHNHFGEAIPLLEDIISNHRKSFFAPEAAFRLLDSLNYGDRKQDIPKWVDRMKVMPELTKNAELKANLDLLERQSLRLAAEDLDKKGDAKACGLMYVEILKRYPDADDLAQLLHNAADCFQRANLLGAAIKMRQNLIKVKPDDPLAQKSRQLLGANFARVGYFQTAAEYFEEFAKKFGGEKESKQSLGDATFFRRGLGQDDKAIANGRYYIKQYGAKNKEDAAAVHFSMYAVYEKTKQWDKLIAHLNEYLKQWGAHGGVDRKIIAHVKIADVYWRESCPITGVNGACIRIERAKANAAAKKVSKRKRRKGQKVQLPTTCAADRAKIFVIDRKPEYKAAVKNYKSALAAYGGGKAEGQVKGKDEAEKNGRLGQMLYYAARAQFQMGEIEYENYLEIAFPGGLDFRPEKTEASVKKFLTWKGDKEKGLTKARSEYEKVLKIKGSGASHWAIAAASRVGMMFQNIADALYSASIPAVPSDLSRDEDLAMSFIDGYCEGLAKLAEPLDNAAVGELASCLKESTDRSWFNEWSQLCENELSQLKPGDFPPAIELRSEPTFLPDTSDFADVITDIRQ